jgi:protein-disulfide isomerase
MLPARKKNLLGPKAAFQLLALIVVGFLIAYVLKEHAPVGKNVGGKTAVQEVRLDQSSPSLQVVDADVTIIAFSDYGCPACRTAYPAMKRAVLEDTHTRVVYKDWPIFGPASERAAKVAIASSFQGIYPAVHDALMRARSLDGDELRAAVEKSGGSWHQIEVDLVRRNDTIEAQLDRNRRQAFKLGLSGTPGFLIGAILVRGAVSEEQFKRAIAEARQASRAFRMHRSNGNTLSVRADATASDGKYAIKVGLGEQIW